MQQFVGVCKMALDVYRGKSFYSESRAKELFVVMVEHQDTAKHLQL